MIESESLQLVLAAAQAHEKTSLYLSESLNAKGYKFVTPSTLVFLSTLECGVNYGSEIARSLDVSRQMVAKTVRELCKADYLEQREATGKQKEIVFTKRGELLMSDARQLLADVDKILNEKIGKKELRTTVTHLESIRQAMAKLSSAE